MPAWLDNPIILGRGPSSDSIHVIDLTELNAIRPDDNLLAILPLHHAFPFMATLLLPLFSRVKITYLDTLKAEAILRCVKEQQVTILVLTPQRSLQDPYLEVIQSPQRPAGGEVTTPYSIPSPMAKPRSRSRARSGRRRPRRRPLSEAGRCS